jgi:hypothetical protein
MGWMNRVQFLAAVMIELFLFATTSKTGSCTITIQHHSPEDLDLNLHYSENFKFSQPNTTPYT